MQVRPHSTTSCAYLNCGAPCRHPAQADNLNTPSDTSHGPQHPAIHQWSPFFLSTRTPAPQGPLPHLDPFSPHPSASPTSIPLVTFIPLVIMFVTCREQPHAIRIVELSLVAVLPLLLILWQRQVQSAELHPPAVPSQPEAFCDVIVAHL